MTGDERRLGLAPDVAFGPELRLDLPAPDTTAAVQVAALLGDPVRAGILALLRDGPHCVCEMAAALDERQNNVSNHLARMREAGLVRAVRRGTDSRRSYYERDEAGLARAREAVESLIGTPAAMSATRLPAAGTGVSVAAATDPNATAGSNPPADPDAATDRDAPGLAAPRARGRTAARSRARP